jgi:hypothetical protein
VARGGKSAYQRNQRSIWSYPKVLIFTENGGQAWHDKVLSSALTRHRNAC